MAITKEQFENLELRDELGYDRWHRWQVESVDQENKAVIFLGPSKNDRCVGTWDDSRGCIIDEEGNLHEGLNNEHLKLYAESVHKVLFILILKYGISPEDIQRLRNAISEEEYGAIANAVLT